MSTNSRRLFEIYCGICICSRHLASVALAEPPSGSLMILDQLCSAIVKKIIVALPAIDTVKVHCFSYKGGWCGSQMKQTSPEVQATPQGRNHTKPSKLFDYKHKIGCRQAFYVMSDL